MSRQKTRMTHQRQIILEEVRKVNTHPTADEVYEMVRRRLPRISLGTVYRNLDVLSKTGLIKRMDPAHSQMRFDGNTKEHYHITCLSCGRIEDVPMESPDHSIEHMKGVLINLSKYRILGHKLEFTGLCPKCAEEG